MLIDRPRQSLVCAAPKPRSIKPRAREVARTNTAAIRQAITVNACSQPAMSCQTGSVNR